MATPWFLLVSADLSLVECFACTSSKQVNHPRPPRSMRPILDFPAITDFMHHTWPLCVMFHIDSNNLIDYWQARMFSTMQVVEGPDEGKDYIKSGRFNTGHFPCIEGNSGTSDSLEPPVS